MPDPKKTQQPETQNDERSEHGLSRRNFLKGASAFVAVASIGAAASCQPAEPTSPVSPAAQLTNAIQYEEPPPIPMMPPDPTILRFFTPHEARTVDAMTARILPGSPEDPGAREAGVMNYIDYKLSIDQGFNEATYRQPPYVQIYEGDAPPQDAPANTIWVPADQIERYGYQSILTPREVFRLGLAAVDTFTNSRFGKNFVDLSEAQQDEIITAMANGEATGFGPITGESFFHVVRRHVSEGMFSDPAYGGNREMVGWKLIGYPGAQRAYTEHDIRTEGNTRAPQSLHELHHFHPGQNSGPEVVLPVSGSRLEPNPKHDPFWPIEKR